MFSRMVHSRRILYAAYNDHACELFKFLVGSHYRKQQNFRNLSSSMPVDQIEKFILENTEVTRDHLTPEIALHLITPKCKLWYSRSETCEVDDPFWAFYWPGGQGLTRYILDNGSSVAGRTVLDVGSGCGSSAIAALMRGAKKVVANDVDSVAAKAISMNAKLNQVSGLEISTKNMIESSSSVGEIFDSNVILLGDMFYDEEFTRKIYDWLSLAPSKTSVLIGDPGRAAFLSARASQRHLQVLNRYELSEQSRKENNGLTHASVWSLKFDLEQCHWQTQVP